MLDPDEIRPDDIGDTQAPRRMRTEGHEGAYRPRTVVPVGVLSLAEWAPSAAENDVGRSGARGGVTPGESNGRGTWTDRLGRDRDPDIQGHEVAGVVAEIGFTGTTGRPVGPNEYSE